MKDPFNGKIKPKYTLQVTGLLSFIGFCNLPIAIVALLFPILFVETDYFLIDVIFYVISGIFFLFAIINHLLLLRLIRNYPRHKRLVHLIIKPYMFISPFDEDEEF